MRSVEEDVELSLFERMTQSWFEIRRKIGEGVERWIQILSLQKHRWVAWGKMC